MTFSEDFKDQDKDKESNWKYIFPTVFMFLKRVKTFLFKGKTKAFNDQLKSLKAQTEDVTISWLRPRQDFKDHDKFLQPVVPQDFPTWFDYRLSPYQFLASLHV